MCGTIKEEAGERDERNGGALFAAAGQPEQGTLGRGRGSERVSMWGWGGNAVLPEMRLRAKGIGGGEEVKTPWKKI